MTPIQEYLGDRFWDPRCFWCTSMTRMMAPFQELEFIQIRLLHIPAYKHLTSLIGLRWQQSWRRNYVVLLSGYHSMLPRPNWCLKSSLIPVQMNDMELPWSATFSSTCFYTQVGLETLCLVCRKTGIPKSWVSVSISEIPYHWDHSLPL